MHILFFTLFFVLIATPLRADFLMPGEPLTRERLEAMLMTGLDGDSEDRRLDVRIHQPALPMPNHAQAPMELELIDIATDGRKGTFEAQLSATLETGESSVIGIRGRIAEMMPVIVPTRTFQRGEKLDANEMEISWQPLSRLQGEPVASITEIVGKEAGKPLRRNRPVYLTDLREPRLICQGEIVEVLFKAPGIELVAFAEALDHGSRGEIVRLANIDSGKRFRAIVTERKQAIVTSSPMGVRQ